MYIHTTYDKDLKIICVYTQMGRIQVVLNDEIEERFRKSLAQDGGPKKGDISEEIERLILVNFSTVKDAFLKQSADMEIDSITLNKIEDFYSRIPTLEMEVGKQIILHEDNKTGAVYAECHVSGSTLVKNMDLDAVIDPLYQEEFRANRELQPDNPEFKKMVEDAKNGRQFSDIVVEYNTEYVSEKPLKILGGQHRSEAIKLALPTNNRHHGIRVYFNLDKSKRRELYIVSNTNIQVPRDLLDRLDEQSLDPPNKLRNFCHHVGILKEGKDFGEARTTEDPLLPTVRMMRTFIVNFFKGKNYKGEFDSDALIPDLSSSGGIDQEYKKLFDSIEFLQDTHLVEAGKNFAKLHKKQFEEMDKTDIAGKKEFRIKAISLSVLSSWACASGLLQRNDVRLKKLYSLPDLSFGIDPLNAKAMAEARLEDIDPENYRGLGTRTEAKERGRLLKLFLLYSESTKSKITLDMCNAAIKAFHAEEARIKAEKSKKKAFG